ncbi:hypothetical protein Aab01nite_63760 [Paractinoplanes abujensis]|nr:hypothetical protein Aab01nite_63760 [Actinoplanes abujensis]
MAAAIRSAACCCLATDRACRRLASVSPAPGPPPRAGRVDTGAETGRLARAWSDARPLVLLVVKGMGVDSPLLKLPGAIRAEDAVPGRTRHSSHLLAILTSAVAA